jgi:hypothetical protein
LHINKFYYYYLQVECFGFYTHEQQTIEQNDAEERENENDHIKDDAQKHTSEFKWRQCLQHRQLHFKRKHS